MHAWGVKAYKETNVFHKMQSDWLLSEFLCGGGLLRLNTFKVFFTQCG